MKLKELQINSLYNSYDYNVNFNSDVTLLYGSNGCGKTTILNIIANIITGDIHKLFEYKFDSINLSYYKCNYSNEINSIVIESKNPSLMKLKFEDRVEMIQRFINNFEDDYQYDIKRRYFEEYPILKEIMNTFNYVYLPLDRNNYMDFKNDRMLYRHIKNRVYKERSALKNNNIDIPMIHVEELIGEYCARMNSKISKINDDFRNELLKSSLNVNKNYEIVKIANQIRQELPSEYDIRKTQKAYIKILNEINLINEEEEKQYNKFFEDFIKELNENKYDSDESVLLALLLRFSEVLQIRKVVELAESMENKKAKVREPLETFLKTINEFIDMDDEEQKRIDIDIEGRIYFTTAISKKTISVQHLSSGEKQILTFFSNLIFEINSGKTGIFVVDEPELSLHLAWQKIFIKKTLEINKNIQLIFATHSPEIVSNYINKTYRLVKKHTENIEGEK